MNIDWNLCFICQQQGKDKLRSTQQGIKATNLFGFWQFGVLDAACSNVLSTVQNDAEFESYLTEKEAKYHQVCANRYDSQKFQRVKDNKILFQQLNVILLVHVYVERKINLFCRVLFVTKKIYQTIFMLLVRIMPKEKWLMLSTILNLQKSGKKWP